MAATDGVTLAVSRAAHADRAPGLAYVQLTKVVAAVVDARAVFLLDAVGAVTLGVMAELIAIETVFVRRADRHAVRSDAHFLAHLAIAVRQTLYALTLVAIADRALRTVARIDARGIGGAAPLLAV